MNFIIKMEFPHDNYYKLNNTDLDIDTNKNINFNVSDNDLEKIKLDTNIQAILAQLTPIITQQETIFNSELNKCFITQTAGGKSSKKNSPTPTPRKSTREKKTSSILKLDVKIEKPSRKTQSVKTQTQTQTQTHTLIKDSLYIQSIYTPDPETKTAVLVSNYKNLCILHNNELIELLKTPSPEKYQTHPLAYYLRYNLAARELLAQLLNMPYNGIHGDSYRYAIYNTIQTGLKNTDMLIHGGAYAISNITSELIPDKSLIQHEGTVFTLSDAILDITIIYELETKSIGKRTSNLSTRIRNRLYSLFCMMLGTTNATKILQSSDRNTPIDWNNTEIYIYHDKKSIKVKWFQFEFIKISFMERTSDQIAIFKSLPWFVLDNDAYSYRFTLEGLLTFNARADSIQFNNNYERAVITRYLEYLYNLRLQQLPNGSIPSLNDVYNSIITNIRNNSTNLWSNWLDIYEFLDNKVNSTIDKLRDVIYGILQPHIFKFIKLLNDALKLESLRLARAVLGGGAVVVLHDSQNSKPIDDYDIYIFVCNTRLDGTQYSVVELEQNVDHIRIIIAKCIYSFYLYLKTYESEIKSEIKSEIELKIKSEIELKIKSEIEKIEYQIRYADAIVFKDVNLFSMDCRVTIDGRQREFSFLDIVIPRSATYPYDTIESYSKIWQINADTSIYISSLARIMNTLQTMVIANRFDKLFKDAYRIQVIKNLFLKITGSETTIPFTYQYNIIHPNDLRDKTSVYYITTPAINYDLSTFTFDPSTSFVVNKDIDRYAYNCLLTSIYIPKPEYIKKRDGYANGRYKINYDTKDIVIVSINPYNNSIGSRVAFLSSIYPANSLKGGNKYKKTMKTKSVSKSKSKSANKCNVNNKDQGVCIIS